MNETLKTIHNLRSIHGDFSSEEVAQADLETILNACVRAANASNRQSYSIIVVEDRAAIKEYLGYKGSKALIFCVDFNRITDTARHLNRSFSVCIRDFITGSIDTILVAQTAAIAAKSLGIDSLFTNSIHRGDITRIYRQFGLPEKYCFPLISLILGYPTKEPDYLRGRLSGKGVIHYSKYHNLTGEELTEIVQEYDDPRRHLGTTGKWKDQGFLHYLDWFYSVWSKRNSENLTEKLREFYAILNKAGFLESGLIRNEDE